MIDVIEIKPQIVEIRTDKDLTPQHWLQYQDTVSHVLDTSSNKLYVLSNFANVQCFDSDVIEIDSAQYLNHPKMGLNVIYCKSSVMTFMLKLSENRAQKAGKPLVFRVCQNFDCALEMLESAYSKDTCIQN